MDSEIEQFLQKLDLAVDMVMVTAEAETIKGVLPVYVDEKVYEKYDPVVYERAGDEGGLSDPKNYQADYDKISKTLTVEVVRDDSPEELARYKGHYEPYTIAEIVEAGGPYRYRPKKKDIGPRPFTKQLETDWTKSRGFEGILVEGLRMLGFDADIGDAEPPLYEEDSVYGELPF